MTNVNEKLEWKQVGARWIAYVDAKQDYYEVSKNYIAWECSLMRHHENVVGRAATTTMATLDQAKQIAEQHWTTGVWAEPKGTTYVLFIEFADESTACGGVQHARGSSALPRLLRGDPVRPATERSIGKAAVPRSHFQMRWHLHPIRIQAR
jgi:hypothetical protein